MGSMSAHSPAVEIRPPKIGDAPGLGEVHYLGWKIGYAGLLPQDFLDSLEVAPRIAQWERWLASGDLRNRTFVAVRDGEIVGFAVVGPTRDSDAASDGATGELMSIYLLPSVKGTGVGHALHQTGMDLLRERGFREATLWVLRDNETAIAFYRRQGWRPDGRTKTDYRGDILMYETRFRIALGEH